MNREQVIKQLEDLRNSQSCFSKDDEIFEKDIQALDFAIAELKKVKEPFIQSVGNYYTTADKCDIVLEKGTKIARYWVNCFDRELVLLLNDYNLTDKDIGEIEMQLDKNYTDWFEEDNRFECCEEFMINNLDTYYKNCIVAVVYESEDDEDE